MSVRSVPGITKYNGSLSSRSILGDEEPAYFKNRIWFNAQLCVFRPLEKSPCKQYVPDWQSSISSWSLRSFVGLAFPHDSTWTLYEDHKAGTRTKALPFLPRGVHESTWGPRRGQPYLPEIDIFPGARLFIKHPKPTNAPEPMKQFLSHTNGVLRLIITKVDEKMRQKALESELARQEVPRDLWYSVAAKLHIARMLLKPLQHVRLIQTQAVWRNSLRTRTNPAMAYAQLYAHYRDQMTVFCQENWKTKGCSELEENRRILEEGLHWFRLPNVTQEIMDILWIAADAKSGYGGTIHFMDYLNCVFGDVPLNRRTMIVKAFEKMDPNKLGHVKLVNLRRFYRSPSWISKQCGGKFAHSISDLISGFEKFIIHTELVDYEEFEAFYRGLSIGLGGCLVDEIKEDSEPNQLITLVFEQDAIHDKSTLFEKLMKDSWGI